MPFKPVNLEDLVAHETLYVVPKQKTWWEYTGSKLDKVAYHAAKTKEQIQRAREPQYERHSGPGAVFKRFDPPEDFSEGSIERVDDNTYKITYGEETIYRAMSKNGKWTFVYAKHQDDKGNEIMRSTCKELNEEYRNNEEHLERLAFDDYCKLKTHVLKEYNLISDAVPCLVKRAA